MSTHGLELGSLDLVTGLVHADGYTLRVLGDGTSFGDPLARVREIISSLADGDLVAYDRAGNREVTFPVQIEGDGLALQAGEVALRRELYKPNTVTWTPPTDFAPPTVFEIVASSMAPRFSDIDELRSKRIFDVTLTCSPFARSRDLTTMTALAPPPVSPTVTVIDDGTSAAGWAAYEGTITAGQMVTSPVATYSVGGAVTMTSSAAAYEVGIGRTISATSFDTTRYLRVEVAWAGSQFAPSVRLVRDGSNFRPPLVLSRALPNGRVVMVWDVGSGSVTQFTFVLGTYHAEGGRVMALSAYDVSRTDTLEQVSSRQVTRSLAVGGTERTPASIRVKSADGTSALGLTIVHTSPEKGTGYSPPLRRWRVAGNTVTADAATLSGNREPLHPAPVEFRVPTAALPEGGYLLMAMMRSTTAGSHSAYFSSQTFLPAPNAASGQGAFDNRVTFTLAANAWTPVPLGVMTLPSVRTLSGEAYIGIQRDAASALALEIDEAWLFRVDDDCALTIATAKAANLWLDSPTSNTPVPTVSMGDSAATRAHLGSDLIAHGNHVLSADGTRIFTATVGVEWPEASATFYRRWHSNAAE